MVTSPTSQGFVTHCMELLAPLGPVRARRMFGGHGLYADDLFVAIIIADQLFLKVDEQTRPRFVEAGCEPFRYERRGADGTVTTNALGFFQPPEEALESPPLMVPWARLAMEAALRAANAKPAKTTKAVKTAAPRATAKAKAEGKASTAPPVKRRSGAAAASRGKRSPG